MTRAKDPWAAFKNAAPKHRLAARKRTLILLEVERVVSSGSGIEAALAAVGARHGRSERSLRKWRRCVRGVDPRLWMAYLVPKYRGGGRKAECSPGAWEAWLAGLRNDRGITIAENYRRVRWRGAGVWAIPSKRTLVRRTLAEHPELLGRTPPAPRLDDGTAQVISHLRALADALERGGAA